MGHPTVAEAILYPFGTAQLTLYGTCTTWLSQCYIVAVLHNLAEVIYKW
jgi:hypothetical protein